MIPLALFGLCIVSFALLAMATSRQQEVVFRRKLAPSRTLGMRAGGWAGLSLALLACVALHGWGLGLVSYSGYTSAAAGVVYLGLIVRSRLTAS